ncbi:hypothetical protein HMI55_001574 [Coelomomyces lativittatus]|nr:hypothetical protein HMI55_001574 [Coelomomyces lativittatus]
MEDDFFSLDLNFPNIHVSYSRLIKNLLEFLWIAHFDACLFWTLCYYEDSPSSWINTSGLGIVNKNRTDTFTQYLFAFLTSQRTLFFSFRYTTTTLEGVFSVFELIVGAIINGSILGNITNLIQSMDKNAGLDKKEEKHNFKMSNLKAYMKKRLFSTELQQRVRNHNEFEWIRNRGMDEEKLFGGLPKALKQEVANHLYMDLLNSMPLFKSCDSAFKSSLSREMRTITIDRGVYVFRKGDDGQEMYFVQNGAVEILKESGEVITEIKAGSFFGHVALFEACKRTATARTKLTSDLCIIKKEQFDKLLAAYPSTAEEIKTSVEEAKKADQKRRKEEEERKLLEEERERNEKIELLREILKKSKLHNRL